LRVTGLDYSEAELARDPTSHDTDDAAIADNWHPFDPTIDQQTCYLTELKSSLTVTAGADMTVRAVRFWESNHARSSGTVE
jgi:hypothetical protein